MSSDRTQPQTFKRPRRRATSPLPPPKFAPFTTDVREITPFGVTVIERLQNQAGVGFFLNILEQRSGRLDESGNVVDEHSTFEVLSSTSVRTEFGTHAAAVAYAEKALRARSYGGYWRDSDPSAVPVTVEGVKGRPNIAPLKLALDKSGQVAVIDTLSGAVSAGLISELRTPLLVAGLRAGLRFKAVPQLGMNPAAPLRVSVEQL